MKTIGLCGITVTLCAQAAIAHPPKSLDVKAAGEQVEVRAVHQVADPADHFIGEITVKVNDKDAVKQDFTRQNGNEQQVSYIIPGLKKGDTVTVKAECNKSGEKESRITVE